MKCLRSHSARASGALLAPAVILGLASIGPLQAQDGARRPIAPEPPAQGAPSPVADSHGDRDHEAGAGIAPVGSGTSVRLRRDPTRPAAGLQRRTRGTGATTARTTQIPEITLVGRVLRKGRPPAAMIRVNERNILVQVGSEITLLKSSAVLSRLTARRPLDARQGKTSAPRRTRTIENLVLKVKSIDDQDMEFEILETRQTLIVR